jgi:hypothetical protein
MKLKVKKGKHNIYPAGFPFVNEIPWVLPSSLRFCFEFSFHESCLYDSKGDDTLLHQTNKLGGISHEMFDNDVNAVLIGWRANFEKKYIEVYPYFNKDGDIYSSWTGINLYPGQKAQAEIFKTQNTWVCRIENVQDSLEYEKNVIFVKRLGGWFGGRAVAPQNMSLESKFSISCTKKHLYLPQV